MSGTEHSHIANLAERVVCGEPLAVSRAISICESTDVQSVDLLIAALWPHTGQAATIGVTGPPGAGKSTTIAKLTDCLRAQEQTVGILAVDPSSPRTNGSVLGDRIRMSRHSGDGGVFIRSMSSNGALGGVARATFLASIVLDAAGKDTVIIETVGAGQSEVAVHAMVDTTLAVLDPNAGDSIQAAKAGILETPDVIAINQRSQKIMFMAQSILRAGIAPSPDEQVLPVIVEVNSAEGTGIDKLLEAIQTHQLQQNGDNIMRRRIKNIKQQVIELALSRALVPVEGLEKLTSIELIEKLRSLEA